MTITSKARQFQSNHLKGVPLKEIEKMITDAIGTKCRYCDVILTLENISLDHVKPLYRKTKKTKKEQAKLESIDNVQLIDKGCNKVKSDMKSNEYSSFLEMLLSWSNKFPQPKGKKSLKERIISRLKSAGFRFGRK